MVALTDFLANNYLWFLIASIILLFALIGYFVDKAEQKKGISMINKPKEEKNIQDLSASAANKTLGDAVSNTVQGTFQQEPIEQLGDNIITVVPQNTISDMSQGIQNIGNIEQNNQSNTIGFDVLSK